MVVALFICGFATQCLYMNIGALLPAFVNRSHAELSSFHVGCLMSVFLVGYLLAAPLVGVLLGKYGRKNVIIIGVSLMTTATLIFGLAGYFENVWAFYTVSMVARFLQGVADATCNVSIPSVVAQTFPENKIKYLSLYNMLSCMGFCVGPALGSFVYGYLSYVNTFYFFTSFIGIIGFFSIRTLPSSLNNTEQEETDQSTEA